MLSIATCSDICGDSRGTSGILSLLQCTDSIRKSPCLYPFVRETAYLGEGWPFRRVDCHANVRMRASTSTHTVWGLSSGVPEQPVNIQHFIGVLVVGARNGQRADTQWNLKWLKPYTQMYGVLIQVREWVGSDAHMYCNFLTHILLHNMGVEKFHGFFF